MHLASASLLFLAQLAFVSAQVGPASSGWTRYDTLVVAHAAVASIAWLLAAPSAVLLARLGRHLDAWFKVHRAMQWTVVTLTLVAVGLAAAAVSQKDGDDDDDADHLGGSHQRLGIAILGGLAAQVVLGIVAHRHFTPDRPARPWYNVVHIVVGLALLCLGFVEVYEGMDLYARSTPSAVRVVAGILIGVAVVAYLAGVVALVWTRRNKEQRPWVDAAAGLGRKLRSDGPPRDALPMAKRELA